MLLKATTHPTFLGGVGGSGGTSGASHILPGPVPVTEAAVMGPPLLHIGSLTVQHNVLLFTQIRIHYLVAKALIPITF